MQPFQLDFPIPEIGALAGDWITVHPRKGVVLMRQLQPETVNRLRAHLDRLSLALGPATAQPESHQVALRRVK
jgi:hypothetical protein